MFELHDVQAVSPALDHYTHSILLPEVWKRSDLSPRDRSIVTVAALIARSQSLAMTYYFVASAQVAQVPFHLNKAMDNGVTQSQASEVLTHLAFYAGWPNAMSAVPVFKAVFEQRSP